MSLKSQILFWPSPLCFSKFFILVGLKMIFFVLVDVNSTTRDQKYAKQKLWTFHKSRPLLFIKSKSVLFVTDFPTLFNAFFESDSFPSLQQLNPSLYL